MKVFGSDIGCKNLAYCIFNVNDNNIINIDNWDLIDLRECKCCRKIRGGKECNKTANYYYIDDDNNIKKVCSSHKCSNCKKIKFDEEDDLNIYASKLKKYFIDNNININCDKYGLENQPSLKNPKMKSIQMLLFSYLSYFKDNNNEINLIHPKMKLSIVDKLTKDIIKSVPKNKQYKITKELGIIITKYIINHQVENKTKWLKVLEDKIKRDDLCDAFLHGYYLVYGKDYHKDNNELIDYINSEIKKFK